MPWTGGRTGPTAQRLLFIALCGLAVFGLALVAVELGGRLAPLDAQAVAGAQELGSGLPRTAVTVVTALGALPTAATLVGAAALLLVARGRPRAAASLAFGLLAVFVVVRLVKLGVARPRPPRHDRLLTDAGFPSAHAAYSTAWLAVAVALTSMREAARATTRARGLLIAAALLVALVIGVTRLLLDAHYLSDVVGGWGLGAALFALAGAGTLAVGSMRHTRDRGGERAARERTETTA